MLHNKIPLSLSLPTLIIVGGKSTHNKKPQHIIKVILAIQSPMFRVWRDTYSWCGTRDGLVTIKLH